MGVDRQTKHKITAVTAKRYRTVDRKGKTTILDEFTAITGYNRKYTLYILAHWDSTRTTVLDGKTVRPKAAKPKHKTETRRRQAKGLFR